MPLILLQLCSVCRIPEVPGEIRVPKKPVSSAQRQSSLIHGLMVLQCCQASAVPALPSLVTSICVWPQSCTFLSPRFPHRSPSHAPPSIIREEPGTKSALLPELFVRKVFELCTLTGVHKSNTLKFHYRKVAFTRHAVRISRLHKGSSY